MGSPRFLGYAKVLKRLPLAPVERLAWLCSVGCQTRPVVEMVERIRLEQIQFFRDAFR